MARSRRRQKKGKPKVQVGLPAKKRAPNKLPKAQTLILPSKETIEWDVEGTLLSNYRAAGFVVDPNASIPRASACWQSEEGEAGGPDKLGKREGDSAEEEEPEELQVVLGKRRKAGAVAPRYERLTKMQRTHIGRLLEKHGLDFQAMSRDIRLNRLQHTPGALKFLCARFLAYEPRPANLAGPQGEQTETQT